MKFAGFWFQSEQKVGTIMTSYKETFNEAINLLTLLGYENIDTDILDIRFDIETQGCCDYCRSDVQVRIVEYEGKEFYL